MGGPDGHVPDAAQTEASLLARAQAGDVAAFERLSGAYADRLFMLLFRLLGDRAEAEDVAQEVMLRAWRGISRFRGQSSFFTWLYRIAVNEANRALDKRARLAGRGLDRRAGTGTARRPGGGALPAGREQRAAPGPEPGPGRPAAAAAHRHRAARRRRALHPGGRGDRRRRPSRVQEPAAPGAAAGARGRRRRGSGQLRQLSRHLRHRPELLRPAGRANFLRHREPFRRHARNP